MKELIKKDIKLIINFKKIILANIIFIFIFVSFSMMFSDYMEENRILDQVNIGIIDEENSFLTTMLVDNFKQNEAFSGLFSLEVDSEEVLLEKYHNNELSALIYIPETFTDSLYRFENTPLKMTLNPNYPLKNVVLENIMISYSTFIKSVDVGIYSLYDTLKDEGMNREELREINERFSMKMVLNALGRDDLFEIIPLDTYPSASAVDYFAYSIMILIIIFAASSASGLFNEEIKNDSLKRYKVTGHSLSMFSLSKTLVLTMNICLMLLPLLLLIKYVNVALTWTNYFIIIAILLMSVWVFVCLSLTIGILLYKYQMNALFSTLLTLILGILGGQFIPIQVMPKFVQNISAFTPNYWILKSLLHLNQNTIHPSLGPTIIIMLLTSIMFSFVQGQLIKRSHIWIK